MRAINKFHWSSKLSLGLFLLVLLPLTSSAEVLEAYYPTCSGRHVCCNNQGRIDGVLPLECSIHGTIPLPGGGSSCTGL
ncbi:unnamed protein product [Gadus morhua 'NCC']